MRRRIERKYIVVILVIFGITTLHYIGALQPLERLWGNSIAIGGSTTSSFAGKLQFWHGWKEKEVLQDEIFSLQNRLQRNESSLARLKALEKENKELKDSIAWNETRGVNTLIGKVIGKPINYPSSYVIINRGSKDGLNIGQPLFINEDVLVGRVESLEGDTAIAQLITDNQSSYSVRKSDGEEAIGLVSGKLGLSLELSFVPSTEEIILGDILVTSGLDPLIPEGLIIGSVDKIQTDKNDFFQTGNLTLSYNPNELSILSILLSR